MLMILKRERERVSEHERAMALERMQRVQALIPRLRRQLVEEESETEEPGQRRGSM